MMQLLITLLVNAAAIFITAYVLPGVHLDGPLPAVITAVVLGLVNMVLKPILLVLTLPITLLTLGLFVLVINALLVLVADALVPGFEVDGFWWALLFSIVLSLVNGLLHKVVP